MNNIRSSIKKMTFVVVVILLVLAATSLIIFPPKAGRSERGEEYCVGIPNPAAAYCKLLGYDYEIVHTEKGDVGYCIFPDGSKCEEWSFYAGKCGQKYSYCVKNGYGIETRSDGRDPYSLEYSTCIMPDKTRVPASKLMNLGEKLSKCGIKIEKQEKSEGDFRVGQSKASKIVNLPRYFNWRDVYQRDWVTPVKSQGWCGSCWAFAAVGVVEAQYNIALKDPTFDLDLSEEYLVSDCDIVDHGVYAGSCCGGSSLTALQYIRDYGIVDEACFPYQDINCQCPGGSCQCTYSGSGVCSNVHCPDRCSDWANRLWTIDDVQSITYDSSDPSAIKEHLITVGPLRALMGIGSQYGGYWDGDIYRCSDDSGINHAVVIVGYDDAGGYWIVKNSWGTGWGDQGYFKVGYGECRIEDYVAYGLKNPPIDDWPMVKHDPQRRGYTSDISPALNYAIKWRHRFNGWIYSPVVADVRVYVQVGGGPVYALDAETGEIIWSNDNVVSPSIRASLLTPVYEDGILYALIEDDKIARIDASTGELLQLKTVNPISGDSLVLRQISVSDGRVYAVGQESVGGEWKYYLRCFDGSLNELWNYYLGKITPGDIYFHAIERGYIYVISNNRNSVCKLEASTGAEQWCQDAPEGEDWMRIAADGERLVLLSWQFEPSAGYLYVLSAEDGSTLWEHELYENAEFAITSSEIIVITWPSEAESLKLISFDKSDGSINWEKIINTLVHNAEVIVSGSHIHLAVWDDRGSISILSLDKSNGDMLWFLRIVLPTPEYPPSLSVSRGRLYFAYHDWSVGNVYCLDEPPYYHGFDDGDSWGDLTVWRPGNGYWYTLSSLQGYSYKYAFTKQWGLGSLNDVPLVGDIDGDNLADMIIWRPGDGRWYILKSSKAYDYSQAFIKQWGLGKLDDKPLIGDIDGDGKDDLVIWRPGNGRWYILKSSTGYDYSQAFIKQWGSGALNDIPLLGDIDGDGIDDLIIWRPGDGRWYILKSSTGYDYSQAFIIQWGSGALNDEPLVGDIDGDGRDDLVIWRPGNGRWYILKSSANYVHSQAFVKQWGSGALNDIPLLRN